MPSSLNGEVRYGNSRERLRIIVRNQGWRQLFAGLSINYIKVTVEIETIEVCCSC